jgi:hypothetical protein
MNTSNGIHRFSTDHGDSIISYKCATPLLLTGQQMQKASNLSVSAKIFNFISNARFHLSPPDNDRNVFSSNR